MKVEILKFKFELKDKGVMSRLSHFFALIVPWRSVRVADGARLESV